MSLVTLQEILSDSIEKRFAVGGFVTFDYASTEAIIKAAESTGSRAILMIPWPMIADRYNRTQYINNTIDMVKDSSAPIVVHLDHGSSFEDCMSAIHSGFSSVMYDGSSLPFEENIKNTKRVVEAAHACGVSVEAEIGHVGGAEGGALIKNGQTADNTMYTTIEEAISFVDATHVDALAIAIGTVHGIVRGTPKLDLNRLSAIRSAIHIPLVLHGGSGLSDKAFRDTIENGINKINYFTEMSLTASNTVRNFLLQAGDNPVHMMDITTAGYNALETLVAKQMKVFRLEKEG